MCDEALLDQSDHCPACMRGSTASHNSFPFRDGVFCAILFYLEFRTRRSLYPSQLKGKYYAVHCVKLCLIGVIQHSICYCRQQAQVFVAALLFEPSRPHIFYRKNLLSSCRCCFPMTFQMHSDFSFCLSFPNRVHYLPPAETKDV